MNGYDFDKTIYRDDSTVDFFRFCLRRHKKTLLTLPGTGIAGVLFLLRLMPKTTFKQIFFRFLRYIPDVDASVAAFWEVHRHKIKPCYVDQKRSDDIILSASPEFLLGPVLSDVRLIASRVDPHTGRFTGENCFGEEKVVRLMEQYPGTTFEAFYSDSLSDAPLAMLAERAYLVDGDECRPWPSTAQQ